MSALDKILPNGSVITKIDNEKFFTVRTKDNKEAEYIVLTDDEANEHTQEYIEESISYFTPSFLSSFTNIPSKVFEVLQDDNETVLELVNERGGIETFCEEAIATDGRGHFLSGYDGKELESNGFFIYRTN